MNGPFGMYLKKQMQTDIILAYDHIINTHDKTPCSICGKLFGIRRIRQHIQSKHTANSEKQHKCSVCAKGFINKQRLQDHMNMHTGEKPYMCNFCGSTFANNSNRLMHERTVHKGHKRN